MKIQGDNVFYNYLNCFINNVSFKEKRPALLSQIPAEPRAPEQQRVSEAPPVQQRQEAARQGVREATNNRVQQVTEQVRKDRALMTGLLELAKNKEMTQEQKNLFNEYIQGLANNGYRELQTTVNDTVVKYVLAKSADGKFISVSGVAFADSKGYASTAFRNRENNSSPLNNEFVRYFHVNGSPVETLEEYNQVTTNAKFPDRAIGRLRRTESFDESVPEGKLAKIMDNVRRGGREKFNQEKNNIENLIGGLNLTIGQTIETKNLPGGFRIAYGTHGPAKPYLPDIIIFRNGIPICFRQGNEMQFADPNINGRQALYPERIANIVSAHMTMEKALSSIRFNAARNPIIDPNTINALQWSAYQFQKFNAEPRDWERFYASANVTMKFKLSPDSYGNFSFRFPNGTIYYNTNRAGWIGTEGVGTPRWMRVETFFLTAEEREAERGQEAVRQSETARREDEARNKENQRAQEARQRLEATTQEETTQFESKEKNANMEKLLNPSLKQHLRQDPNNPYALTVVFQGSPRESARLERTTRIHDLFKLREANQVINVKVEGSRGNVKGMFYPGQQTIYKLDAQGKQTNERVKIFNNDEIQIQLSNPDASHIPKLRRGTRSQETPEILTNRNLRDEKKNLLNVLNEGNWLNSEDGRRVVGENLKPVKDKVKTDSNVDYAHDDIVGNAWESQLTAKISDITKQNTILSQEINIFKTIIINKNAQRRAAEGSNRQAENPRTT